MSKTILITGSSRGIGKAIAVKAAADGFDVIVHGKTDSGKLNETLKEIEGSIKTFFDIADKEETHKAIGKLGHIDVLVNNAGVARNFLKDISEVDDEKALEEYKTNILGTIHCSQAVIPSMLEKDNSAIISIASIKGQYNLATMSTLTFGTTKAGIISLTKALAKAYPTIRFCSVSPGYIETDQVSDWNEQTFSRINDGTILGRIGKPEEIANTVMFLASDGASYVTGSDFLVDGGYSIKGK